MCDKNLLNSGYVMPDDMVLGVFDSDGSVLIVIDSHEKDSMVVHGNQPFGLRVLYYLEQSVSKTDLVLKVAEKFNGSVLKNETGTRLRVNQFSKVGKRIRLFLSKNKPLHPNRRRDYLIAETINNLLNKKVQRTKAGLVTLICLAYSNTQNMIQVRRKNPIQYWIHQIQPSEAELKAGEAKASEALALINKEVVLLKEQLPHMKLSLDYIRGAHFGDGGLTVALTWKPNKQNRRRCVPEWTISGENFFYCKAFVNTLGGDINKSSANCYKFRLYGIARCKAILYIFDHAT
jgi:hypothetical protein